jgi:hypothetical protein
LPVIELRRKIGLLAGACTIGLTIVAGSALLYPYFFGSARSEQGAASPRAAILDQLSLTSPNPGFAQTATQTLEGAGYHVDYYAGDQVTVDLIRNLPAGNYALIVFRSHVARVLAPGGRHTDDVMLFTNEDFDASKYYAERSEHRLGRVFIDSQSQKYFGILDQFIEQSLEGRFTKATVLLMGCNGARSDAMAKAFLDSGADGYASWNDEVSPGHNDLAAEDLLERLAVEKLTLTQAVNATMAEVGPDATYNSSLVSYSQ